jgi:hypothetical protein
MKHFIPARVSFFLFGCILCWSVAAQAYEIGDWNWNPTLSVNETYDSNVSFAPDHEISDWITAIAPGVEGVFDGKNRYAKVKGLLHEKIFAEHDDFNNLSEDLSGIFKQELSKYDRIAMTNSFLHADQPSSFDDEFGRQSGRYDFYKNLFTATYGHDFSSQLNTVVNYANDFYDPSRDDLAQTDQNRIGVQTNYAVNSQTIPFAFYEYSNRYYDPGGTISRNSIGGGIKQYLTEQVYVDAKVGADFLSPIGREDITKPEFFVGVTDEVDPTTVYGLSFTKHYEDSSYDQNLFNSWRFSLNWGKELMERLQGIVTAFTGGGKFEPDGAKEHLNGIGFVLNYEATRNSILSMGYAFTDKNSNDNTRDYTKNAVSLNWKIKF